MVNQNRISPVTALVVGLFGVGAVGIAAGTAIVLKGMQIVDTKATALLGFAEHTLEGLPELIESLPPTIADVLNDRRAPGYTANLDITASFVPSERHGGLRPVMTIKNNGNEVVSMLAVRVAALSGNNVPIREWTEVVATPIAIEGDWRGLLMPGATRYVLLSSGWRTIPVDRADGVAIAVEVSEIRIWQPQDQSPTTAAAGG